MGTMFTTERIWNRELGAVAVAVRESGNEYDRYAVAILESETCCTVGYLPQEIERYMYFSDGNEVLMLRHILNNALHVKIWNFPTVYFLIVRHSNQTINF